MAVYKHNDDNRKIVVVDITEYSLPFLSIANLKTPSHISQNKIGKANDIIDKT